MPDNREMGNSSRLSGPDLASMFGPAEQRSCEDVASSNYRLKVLEAIIEHVGRHLDIGRMALYRLDSAGENASCILSRGLEANFLEIFERKGEEPNIILTDLVKHGGSIDDVHQDLRTVRVKTAFLDEGIRSLRVIPILIAGRVGGGLALYSTQLSDWSNNDSLLANQLASQLWLALDNWELSECVEEALAAKESFLSKASHDLRTPLTSVIGYAQYLQRYLSSKPDVDFEIEQLKVIETQAIRMSRMLQDILEARDLEKGDLRLKKDYLNLTEVALEAINALGPLNNEQSVELQASVPMPELFGDRLRLKQVVSRLITSAANNSLDDNNIVVRLDCKGNYALVAVQSRESNNQLDDRLRHSVDILLFEDKQRERHKGGAGLSLKASKKIIEAHGGHLWVETADRGNRTFWFSLPLRSFGGNNNGLSQDPRD